MCKSMTSLRWMSRTSYTLAHSDTVPIDYMSDVKASQGRWHVVHGPSTLISVYDLLCQLHLLALHQDGHSAGRTGAPRSAADATDVLRGVARELEKYDMLHMHGVDAS